MGRLILVTGGARSGKSSFAEGYAKNTGLPVTYLATSRIADEEMRARIDHHRAQRPAHWSTLEADTRPGETLSGARGAVLLDCITMLVANLMVDENVNWDQHTDEDDERCQRAVDAQIESLITASRKEDITLIVVTNELGMGLVPVYPFGRVFRDVAGRANQRLAAAADEAYLLVSGIAVKLR